jgi:hypothetical protein
MDAVDEPLVRMDVPSLHIHLPLVTWSIIYTERLGLLVQKTIHLG